MPELSAGGAGATGDVECILTIKTGGKGGVSTGRQENVQEALSQRLASNPTRRTSATQVTTGPKRTEIIEMDIHLIQARGLKALDKNAIGEYHFVVIGTVKFYVLKLCYLVVPCW